MKKNAKTKPKMQNNVDLEEAIQYWPNLANKLYKRYGIRLTGEKLEDVAQFLEDEGIM